ncbi:MAG: DUF393 domain-containing protein [Sciscionella sp.]|nr:DUF393 domain-containing protein [Sciscionella sp.]
MTGTLIFDGDCGFCTACRDLLTTLDRRGRINAVPLQRPGIAERIGCTTEQLLASVWWLDDDGERCSGAHAVNAALSAALGTRAPLWLYRRSRWLMHVQDATYRWIAANRHRFPGRTPYCVRHPADCGAALDDRPTVDPPTV